MKMVDTDLRFSQTMVDVFKRWYNAQSDHYKQHIRVGQSFHQYFDLNKITSDNTKVFCDQLYELNGSRAWEAIRMITDHEQ